MSGDEQSRIQVLNPPYEPEIGDMLEKWMPPNSGLEPLKLFRVMANNPELMSRMRPLGAGLLGKSSLIEPLEREIVIDRTCFRCGCEYEWGVHVTSFGKAFGISPEKLAQTAQLSPDSACFTLRENLLIQLVDQLHETAQITDDLWAKLALEWNQQQLLELIVLAGWYHVISFIANATHVPKELWAARFD